MKEALDPLAAWIRPDEQCVALTRDFRLVQRLRGHRYSVDDMLVAHLACTRAGSPGRVLDLGCGIASVLLMVAWAFPHANFVGIEAQPEHVALARRNVVLNGCEQRVKIEHADLRDLERVASHGLFDLVTGTPPYFDPKAATVCSDPQRAYAQWELRGGIEAYAAAASRALAFDGVFVTCAAAEPRDRARRALEREGLRAEYLQPVEPRIGRAPFLVLLVARRGRAAAPYEAAPVALRNLDGTRTPAHIAAREWFGIPCGLH
jgi:tRNA1(Val) A37 N6-methylase TrmN6